MCLRSARADEEDVAAGTSQRGSEGAGGGIYKERGHASAGGFHFPLSFPRQGKSQIQARRMS